MIRDIQNYSSDHIGLNQTELQYLLELSDSESIEALFERARSVRDANCGRKVFTRALIEFSNKCSKNCLYCGIRAGNKEVCRYEMTTEEVLSLAKEAFAFGFINFVIQSGERKDKNFTGQVTEIVNGIREITGEQAGITLSCGEQSAEVYREWLNAGANRYLLRIETSDPELYYQIHPQNKTHDFGRRIEALHDLKSTGYQTGTGIMIGLPGQTTEQLAKDLLFIRDMDVDMVGMGPYIEHAQTPLFQKRNLILPLQERYLLTLKMYASLRLLMKNINIASTTALETIHEGGRLDGIESGCNVVMYNLTPAVYTGKYNIYNNKPVIADAFRFASESINKIRNMNYDCDLKVRGDAPHFQQG